MISLFSKHIFSVSVILFVVADLLFSGQVLAVGKPAEVGQANPGFSNSHQRSIPSNMSSGSMPSFAQVRLQGTKLQACQAVSVSVVARSTHLANLATQMEKTFTSIADSVEQYYLRKVVPTGTTLSSYDTLVADISTKESAVAPLVQTARTDATSFSCTGNNPAAALTQYRTDMQAVLKGLQDYRTSIKNLIVAVRTLPSVKLSGTPAATVAPSVTSAVTP